jgi:hypothetical protein
VLQAIAALFGLLGAWFELRDRGQSTKQREATRAWYEQKWRAVDSSTILRLPETIVAWLLHGADRLRVWSLALAKSINPKITFVWVLLAPVLGGYGLWRLNGWRAGIVFVGFFFLAFAGSAVAMWRVAQRGLSEEQVDTHPLVVVLKGVVFLFPLASMLLFVDYVLTKTLVWATVLLIAMLPVIAMGMASALLGIGGLLVQSIRTQAKLRLRFWLIGLSMALSFPITMLALSLGSRIAPGSLLPQHLQMLLSNVFFDGITVGVTVFLLSRAVKPQSRFPLSVAIVCDVLAAAVFACLSLWFGLAFGPNHIPLVRAFVTLIGRSSETGAVRLGPCFWAMHTAFLPTLTYLGFLALGYAAKLVVLPLAKVLKRGQAVERPHNLTAGLFFFVAALLLALSWVPVLS